MKKTTLLTIVFCFVLTCNHSAFLSSSQADDQKKQRDIQPELAYIAYGLSNTFEKMTSFSVNSSYQSFRPAKFDEDNVDTKSSYTAHLNIKDGLTSQEVNVEPSRYNTSSSIRRIYSDGKIAKILFTRLQNTKVEFNGLVSEGVIQPSTSVMSKHGIWETFEKADPRLPMFFIGSQNLLSDVILHSKANVSYEGEVTYDGSKCMRVNVTPESKMSKDEYWVDVDHGFIIRKVNSFRIADGVATKLLSLESSGLLESSGFWIPSVVDVKFGRFDSEEENPQITQQSKYEEFHMNPPITLNSLDFK